MNPPNFWRILPSFGASSRKSTLRALSISPSLQLDRAGWRETDVHTETGARRHKCVCFSESFEIPFFPSISFVLGPGNYPGRRWNSPEGREPTLKSQPLLLIRFVITSNAEEPSAQTKNSLIPLFPLIPCYYTNWIEAVRPIMIHLLGFAIGKVPRSS